MFTKEELSFMFQMLDQVNIQGLQQKASVVQIMTKIAQELQVVPKKEPQELQIIPQEQSE